MGKSDFQEAVELLAEAREWGMIADHAKEGDPEYDAFSARLEGFFTKHPDQRSIRVLGETPTHSLKTDPEVFKATLGSGKNFEIRRDDRSFDVGDVLYLRETKHTGEEMKNGAPLVYTGRTLTVRVTYILRGPIYGLAEGWVVMSVEYVPDQEE